MAPAKRKRKTETIMAKTTEAMARDTKSETSAARSDTASIVEALQQVRDLLTLATNDLTQFTQNFQAPRDGQYGAAAPTAQINSWDDPFSEATATVNPQLATPVALSPVANNFTGLRTNIVEPQLPAARYAPGTAGFRYWVAAEALARGIVFWGGLLPTGTTWSTSNPMRVTLVDAIEQLNANYSRQNGLRFFRQKVQNFDICACESPDVVCHELGHAVLDALKPQLFNAANTESAAFHESFGDMSAILCALQIQSMRTTVLSETDDHLNVNSRLSRLAEQLGWGIRQLSPTAVDRDSLRNAANRFFYRRPDQLPPSAPANLLSTEEHSFSRVFTGAFLDVLARMFATTGAPNEANLLAVARDIGQLLVDAVHSAPVTTDYFSQIAAAMIQADLARFGGRNRGALTGAFVERGILSVTSALTMAAAPVPQAMSLTVASMAPAAAAGSSIVYTYDGKDIDRGFESGFGETPELAQSTFSLYGGVSIEVHAPETTQLFSVAPAATGDSSGTLNADAAIRVFVEGLIQRREVETSIAADDMDYLTAKPSTRTTHTIVSDKGKMALKRRHFSCRCNRGDWACR
jgi:hypothetical protein